MRAIVVEFSGPVRALPGVVGGVAASVGPGGASSVDAGGAVSKGEGELAEPRAGRGRRRSGTVDAEGEPL